MKVATTIESLCKGLPSEFAEFMQICRYMKFDETPNYDLLRRLFTRVLHQNGFVDDSVFDWMEGKSPNSLLRIKLSGKNPNMFMPTTKVQFELTSTSSKKEEKGKDYF